MKRTAFPPPSRSSVIPMGLLTTISVTSSSASAAFRSSKVVMLLVTPFVTVYAAFALSVTVGTIPTHSTSTSSTLSARRRRARVAPAAADPSRRSAAKPSSSSPCTYSGASAQSLHSLSCIFFISKTSLVLSFMVHSSSCCSRRSAKFTNARHNSGCVAVKAIRRPA